METPQITNVIFRKYPKRENGDIIAIFPDDVADNRGHVSVYQHVGQHGAGDYFSMVQSTKLAKPEEYASLKRELESAPYNYVLRVMKRKQYSRR